jgi:hypothetical protein
VDAVDPLQASASSSVEVEHQPAPTRSNVLIGAA